MSNCSLADTIRSLRETDNNIYEQAQARLDTFAKPPGSLGRLEELAARICAVTGTLSPDISRRCVLVFASDNGVAAEGVSSAPQSVTAAQTINILNGVTGVGVIAKQYGTDIFVTDIGINAEISHRRLIDRKIRKSTGNIAIGPAMTQAEAIKAVETGIELVGTVFEAGYRAIGTGEMGIGNTTTASAVLASLLGLQGHDIHAITGRGAGLDDEGFAHKLEVIERSLTINNADRTDPLDVLAKLGGFDICAMTGAFIGAAYHRIPAVIDGFISVVAALCATRMNPLVNGYLIASHNSFERGYALAASELGLVPCLNLEMRLGEGSGCPLMFGVMDAALAVLKDMATFGEASIDTQYTDNIGTISF